MTTTRFPTSFPTPEVERHLRSRFELPDGAVDAYRREGFVVLRRFLDPEVVEAARPTVLAGLRRNWPTRVAPAAERSDAYSRAFVQITNIGLTDAAVRVFTHARRLGRAAAELMGVRAVRLYCEDWLLKDPGAHGTPWHQDSAVFPFDAEATITAWIPMHAVPRGMGLLRFAARSQTIGLAPVENISEESDRVFSRLIDERGFEVVDVEPFAAGDVSFHDGRLVHGAYPNESSQDRVVLAMHMFADGARIKEPKTGAQRHQLADFARGLVPGDLAASPKWPLVYRDDDEGDA